MSTLRQIGIVVTAILCACLFSCGEDPRAQEVRDDFQAVMSAYQEGDAQTVLRYTAPADVEYYDRIARMVRSGTRQQIGKLTIAERLGVIQARHMASADQLRNLNGPGYIRLAVEQGWWGRSEQRREARLGTITFTPDGKWANAKILDGDGAETRYKFTFVFEDDIWKFDSIGFDAYVGHLIQELARENRLSEDETLVRVLGLMSGHAVRSDIWDRP